MKKLLFIIALCAFLPAPGFSQCTFESLFPLKWESSKYAINEYYQNNKQYKVGRDTISGSAFKHGLNYFFTVRNIRLSFYSFSNAAPIPCFKSGRVTLNTIAYDSGLVAYNYQVDFAANEREIYMQVIDSLRKMMSKKFVYQSTIETKTEAVDPKGNTLTGDGVCVYFNDEPVIASNLTYAPFVIRGGFLAKKQVKDPNSTVLINEAEEVQFYRIEILYKMNRTSW